MKKEDKSHKKLIVVASTMVAVIIAFSLVYVFVLPVFQGDDEEVDFSQATYISSGELNRKSSLDMINEQIELMESLNQEEE